jgi:hypothetical protein
MAEGLRIDAIHPHDLVSRTLSVPHRNPCQPHTGALGDQAAKRLIGLSRHRRRADPNNDCAVSLADDSLPRGARLQADADLGARGQRVR